MGMGSANGETHRSRAGGLRCPAGQARGLKANPPYACARRCEGNPVNTRVFRPGYEATRQVLWVEAR